MLPRRWPCPCCGHLTLSEEPPGTFAVCHVCFWEDDGLQFDEPTRRGGANGVSLLEARANFQKFGAYDSRAVDFVRPPTPDEQADG